MKIINILLLIAVFIFGVIQMRKSSSIIKTDWFKSLSYNEKLEISSFIGKTNYYENIINILILIISVIVTIFLIINNKKLSNDIKK